MALLVKGTQGLHDEGRPEFGQTLHERFPRQEIQHRPLPGAQAKAHVRAGERQPGQPVLRALELRGGTFEEFQTRGHVDEEVAHLDQRAPVQGRGLHGDKPAVLNLHAAGRGLPGIGMGRGHAETRHRGDTRQGFPPEAVGKDMLQIVHAGDLAGGVPGDGQFQLVCRDAPTVVLDADEALAAVLKADVDMRRPGIQAVLHEFLDHAGRAFHHFAGGDLIAQFRR